MIKEAEKRMGGIVMLLIATIMVLLLVGSVFERIEWQQFKNLKNHFSLSTAGVSGR